MLITKKKLQELRACREARRFFKKHYKEIEVGELLRDVLQYKQEVEKYGSDIYNWCYWLIISILSRKAAVQFAVYAAEKVLYIYEDKYPTDLRPRRSIEAAKTCLENPNSATARAADAADAAYAARAAEVDPRLKDEILEFGIQLMKNASQLPNKEETK